MADPTREELEEEAAQLEADLAQLQARKKYVHDMLGYLQYIETHGEPLTKPEPPEVMQ